MIYRLLTFLCLIGSSSQINGAGFRIGGAVMHGPMGPSMYMGISPAQASQLNLMTQMGPNAAYTANMTGQTGTLGAMGFKAMTGMNPMMGPIRPNPRAAMRSTLPVNPMSSQMMMYGMMTRMG